MYRQSTYLGKSVTIVVASAERTYMNFNRNITRRAMLTLSASAVFAGLTSHVVYADPQSDLEAASAKLDSLGAELAQAEEDLNEKTYALDDTNNKIVDVQEQISETEDKLKIQRGILAAAMRSSYKTGPQEALDFILGASSPDDFISRVYYMDRTNKKQSDSINQVRTLGDQLTQQRNELEAQQTQLQEQVAAMKSQADDVKAQIAEAKSYYDSLDAEVKKQLEEQAAAENNKNSNISTAINYATNETPSAPDNGNQNNQEEDDNTNNNQTPSNNNSNNNTPSNTNTNNSDNGSGSGSPYPCGGVGSAYSCLGWPYVWGGASPSQGGFDCGGLVYYCFLGYRAGSAGTIGRNIKPAGNWKDSMDELSYGDCVFTRPGYNHIGIYIGNGQMIHAANEALGVCIGSVWAFYGGGPFSG